MKNSWILSVNSYTKTFATITKLLLVLLALSFIAYSRPGEWDNNTIKKKQGKMNSVSFIKGKYKIDSAIILDNRNKAALLAELESVDLTERKTKEEIPVFIKAFFDSISVNKKFDMANPGEQWRIGDISDIVLTTIDGPMLFAVNEKHTIPNKQLVYFGMGNNIALFSYYSGGMSISQNFIIIKFQGSKVIDFWFDNKLTMSNGLSMINATNKYEIIKYIKQNLGRNGGC